MNASDSPFAVSDLSRFPFLSPTEVALLLRVNESTVRRWIREGRLRALRTARRKGLIRVSREDLQRFLDNAVVHAETVPERP